jgi:hypothetical protein
MRLRFIPIWAALALLAGAVGTSAQSTSTADARKGKDQPSPRQVKVAIDPRSTGEAQSLLIVKGFGNLQANPTRGVGFYSITTSQFMTNKGNWCSQPTRITAKVLPKQPADSSMLKSSSATI